MKLNKAQISGIIRVLADTLTIISGAGFGVNSSIFRIFAGSLGLFSSVFLALFAKKSRSKINTIEIASFFAMTAGSCLFLSGIFSRRPIEAFAGFNIAFGFGIQTFRRKNIFSINPVKLGSDILQINVIFIFLDAIPNQDWARTTVGVLLLTAGLFMRYVDKKEYSS